LINEERDGKERREEEEKKKVYREAGVAQSALQYSKK